MGYFCLYICNRPTQATRTGKPAYRWTGYLKVDDMKIRFFCMGSYADFQEAEVNGGVYEQYVEDDLHRNFVHGAGLDAMLIAARAMECLDGGFSAGFELVSDDGIKLDYAEYISGARVPLKAYEVAAFGFNADGFGTDDRVVWVSAPSELAVIASIEGTCAKFCGEIQVSITSTDIDFRLPLQGGQLKEWLQGFLQKDLDAMETFQGVSLNLQSVIGEYERPENQSTWRWVERNASFRHQQNGIGAGVWEFVLNLALTFEDIPAQLKPYIDHARSKGFAYLMCHQGT